MPTLEEEAAQRIARKARHRELRLVLDLAHTRTWNARDNAKASFEEALTAHLEDPYDADLLEAAATAANRLDGFESLLARITSRRDQAADAGEGI